MYNEKYLLFSTGGGTTDPLNLDRHEMAVYCAKDFKGMKPASGRSLDLFFVTEKGQEIVTLKIKNGLHSKVMQAISNAIVMGNQSIIPIADVDNNIFINTNIYDVIIKSKDTYVQTLTNNSKTQLTVPRSNYKKCMVANIDGSASVAMTLHLTSQLGSDITDTGVNVNNGSGYSVTTSSQAIVVDGTTATDDLLLNERVYKSDGTFIGTCTAVDSGTRITFGGGLEVALADDADLYTGTRYTIFDQINIPSKSTLKLEQDEISFDNSKFDLYCKSGDSDGQLIFSFMY